MGETNGAQRFQVRFNSEIGLGQILQAIVVAAGMAWGVITYANKVDMTQNDLHALRIDMTTQLSAIQLNVSKQFDSVRSDIANLPDVRAELTQLEKRSDQADNRAAALSERIGQVWQLQIQSRADLDNVIRTINPKGKPP